MADIPFRTRVLTALTAALEEITPGNGYITDLSEFNAPDGQPMKRVYRGRGFFGASDPCPMVAVLEPPEDAEAVAAQPALARTTPFNWRLIVQGDVQDDKANPTDPAYALLADVRRRLAMERERKDESGKLPDPLGFGGRREKNRIEELSFGAGIVRPPDEISAKAYFWLGVTLKTIEDPLFPFA
ncbi:MULTISPECIES: hypothetical protein [unclassified Sphingopyxis]|uniref:hypothetical protein n=1 Tax=unclassified Sphingopyxis TaxID=2614943 RepID=UPI002856FBD8|nr:MULTISPECIES: hypothetical protein [unclassified Sphingopyxis]MDR7062016.1 hypothetical protein [Sphingopyxis sp. BE235]MDR7182474.1 hypothetical protein [Sphingopyxis sp. BE249]